MQALRSQRNSEPLSKSTNRAPLKTLKEIIFCIALLAMGTLQAQISPGSLSTAHADLEGVSNCTKCHELGNQVPDYKCLDCHKEIAALNDQNRGYHVSKEVKSKHCIDCHNEHHGRKFQLIRFDTVRFDHKLTGYTLEGKHERIDCRDCHKPDYIDDPDIRERSKSYLGLDAECLTCHEDYHQGELSEDCSSCHTNFEDFRPADGFDHNDADFKLRGAHKKLDCEKCHKKSTRNGSEYQEFTGMKFERCIDCHEDEHNGRFGKDCSKCHTESSFLELKSMNRFNHDKTRFPLRGQHVGVDCKACHKGKFTAAIRHNECKDCHDDYHEGEFNEEASPPDCKDCHTLDKPFDFTSFGIEEHNEGNFSLEGAHLATPCFACHLKEDKWTFRDIGEECKACHEDVHEGKISEKYYPEGNCASCHNPGRWNDVEFDHSKTDWPLKGKHAEISCRKCHFERSEDGKIEIQKFSLLSKECSQCHNNKHGNQFEEGGKTDCRRCHSESGDWKADLFDHSATRFPLEGKHAEVACDACHKAKKDENGVEIIEYKIKRFECIDCHR